MSVPFLLAAAADGAGVFDVVIGGIVAVLVPVLLEVARRFMGDRFNHRMGLVARAIEIAYHATTNVAKFTRTTVDDKAAYALGLVKKQLEAQGVAWDLGIETQARATFDAMHAQEKLRPLFMVPPATHPSTPPAVP